MSRNDISLPSQKGRWLHEERLELRGLATFGSVMLPSERLLTGQFDCIQVAQETARGGSTIGSSRVAKIFFISAVLVFTLLLPQAVRSQTEGEPPVIAEIVYICCDDFEIRAREDIRSGRFWFYDFSEIKSGAFRRIEMATRDVEMGASGTPVFDIGDRFGLSGPHLAGTSLHGFNGLARLVRYEFEGHTDEHETVKHTGAFWLVAKRPKNEVRIELSSNRIEALESVEVTVHDISSLIEFYGQGRVAMEIFRLGGVQPGGAIQADSWSHNPLAPPLDLISETESEGEFVSKSYQFFEVGHYVVRLRAYTGVVLAQEYLEVVPTGLGSTIEPAQEQTGGGLDVSVTGEWLRDSSRNVLLAAFGQTEAIARDPIAAYYGTFLPISMGGPHKLAIYNPSAPNGVWEVWLLSQLMNAPWPPRAYVLDKATVQRKPESVVRRLPDALPLPKELIVEVHSSRIVAGSATEVATFTMQDSRRSEGVTFAYRLVRRPTLGFGCLQTIDPNNLQPLDMFVAAMGPASVPGLIPFELGSPISVHPPRRPELYELQIYAFMTTEEGQWLGRLISTVNIDAELPWLDDSLWLEPPTIAFSPLQIGFSIDDSRLLSGSDPSDGYVLQLVHSASRIGSMSVLPSIVEEFEITSVSGTATFRPLPPGLYEFRLVRKAYRDLLYGNHVVARLAFDVPTPPDLPKLPGAFAQARAPEFDDIVVPASDPRRSLAARWPSESDCAPRDPAAQELRLVELAVPKQKEEVSSKFRPVTSVFPGYPYFVELAGGDPSLESIDVIVGGEQRVTLHRTSEDPELFRSEVIVFQQELQN